MTDRVAERLDADIILPASSVKPEYKGKPTLLKWLTGSARTFRGPVVPGTNSVSRHGVKVIRRKRRATLMSGQDQLALF